MQAGKVILLPGFAYFSGDFLIFIGHFGPY